jgi:hypothetical protein
MLYLLIFSLFTLLSGQVAAQTPDAASIMAKAKAALEPSRPSTSRLAIHVKTSSGQVAKWDADQARGSQGGENWILLVLVAPPEAKGIAMLARQKPGNDAVAWDYIPVIRRVRELSPTQTFEPFLGTEFTYSDLTFYDVLGKYTFIGEEEHGGVKTYKVEGLPRNDYYDSKMVTWINSTNSLPVERDYYDKAGRLWKVELFQDVKDIQGVPTVTKLSMEDKQANTGTEINVSEVHYDTKLPPDLFEPEKLSSAADNLLWMPERGSQSSGE